MGVKDLVKRTLIEKENRAYERRLQSLQVAYGDWAAALETERAARMTAEREESGEFVVICSSEGCLSRNAVKEINIYFNMHPDALILYGDEDVWPGREQGEENDKEKAGGKGEEKVGERRSPWFKPDWSPDLLDSFLYFGSVVAVDKDLFDRSLKEYEFSFSGCGSATFQRGCQEGVDYQVINLAAYEDWLHICVGLAGAYAAENAAVGHLPAILFHCRDEKEQIKFMEDTPRLKDFREEYVREFRNNWVIRHPREGVAVEMTSAVEPVVSVVIPSKDQPDILEKCLRGCLLAAEVRTENLQGPKDRQECEKCGEHREKANPPIEIILVDNGSRQENRARVEKMVRELSAPDFQIRYLYEPMEFHFSRMCNMGAEQAKGSFLLFLNDDVELCLPGCIGQMAALADRFFTGAVGMKLLYPDSDRIQHAGITNLPMGPVHKLQFLNDNGNYYYNANRGRRNVLAVTGACLMVDRDKFAEAGGFAEELRVAFNDVDLCFRLHELGYWNVCMNDIYAFHHESLSRGADESPEKLARLLEERDRLYRRHSEMEGWDPFYPDSLNREGLDTRIRPAYVTAGNRVQHMERQPVRFDSEGWRRDDCLLVRIEDSRDERISGYAVVLGDNNACYKLQLLFEKMEDDCNTYAFYLEEQYRPDLEENMPDQKNVALSGFTVELNDDVLPPGNYRLGLAAKNKVTGLRLINWSNRVLRR